MPPASAVRIRPPLHPEARLGSAAGVMLVAVELKDQTPASTLARRLGDGGIGVRFDTHFVWELPRKRLRNFPVKLEFDRRRRFTELVVFKPERQS